MVSGERGLHGELAPQNVEVGLKRGQGNVTALLRTMEVLRVLGWLQKSKHALLSLVQLVRTNKNSYITMFILEDTLLQCDNPLCNYSCQWKRSEEQHSVNFANF